MNAETHEPAGPVVGVEHFQRERQNYFILGVATGVGAALFGCFILNVVAPLLVFGGIMLFEGPGEMAGLSSGEFRREYEHVDVSEELAAKGDGSIDGFLTGAALVDNISGSGNFTLAVRRRGDVVEEARVQVDENTDIDIEGRRVTLEELTDESPMGRVLVDFEVSRGEILATDVEVDDDESAPDWVFE